MMMVQALRPKITMNSGYTSTIGAAAMAATQVSHACCKKLEAMHQHAAGDAEHREHDAGRQAFAAASAGSGCKTCSSTMTRPKLPTISDGGGTMKRLMTSNWISSFHDQQGDKKRCHADQRRRHKARCWLL